MVSLKIVGQVSVGVVVKTTAHKTPPTRPSLRPCFKEESRENPFKEVKHRQAGRGDRGGEGEKISGETRSDEEGDCLNKRRVVEQPDHDRWICNAPP